MKTRVVHDMQHALCFVCCRETNLQFLRIAETFGKLLLSLTINVSDIQVLRVAVVDNVVHRAQFIACLTVYLLYFNPFPFSSI